MAEDQVGSQVQVDQPRAEAQVQPESAQETPKTPAWAPSPEEWQEMRSMLEQLSQASYGEPEADEFEWDPFSADAASQLSALLQERDERLIQSIRDMLAPIVSKEAEERAYDIIASIEAQEGEFASPEGRDLTRALADRLFPQAAARFGNTVRAAEFALKEAANKVRALEKAAAERALNEYKASLQNVAGAPAETGVAQKASGELAPEAESEMDAIRRLFGTQVTV